MTYSAILATISGKRPAWLYEITKDGTTTLLTSRATDVLIDVGRGAETFTAATISHTQLRVTSAIGRAETDLILPQTSALGQSFLDGIGATDALVTIYHTFLNDPDAEVAIKYRGRAVAVKPSLTRVVVTCENRFTEMRRKALAAVMQRPCRHALYHGGCGLSLASYQTTVTATAWDNPWLTLTTGQAVGYYSGGIASYNGALRFIQRDEGTRIRLSAPLPGLADALPASVSIAPGCDLTLATCDSKFGNSANFGGFPWMRASPYDGRNPF